MVPGRCELCVCWAGGHVTAALASLARCGLGCLPLTLLCAKGRKATLNDFLN